MRTTTTRAAAGLIAAATLGLAACGTPPPRVGDDHVSSQAYPKVQATGGLNAFMRVNNAVEFQENGLLHANVDIRWVGKNPVYYEYRFIFRYGRNRALNADGAWTRGSAEPGTVDYLSANATNPDATDWRLEIRPRNG